MKTAKTEAFEKFDKASGEGVDMAESQCMTDTKRVNQRHKRVNVDFPLWMISELDKEADRLGIPRQSLIKTLIAQHYPSKA